MTKTVEQAVEETGGDANSIVGCSELVNARLYYANGRYAWVSPNHVSDEENNVICARHVYDDFAAKWKAAKNNPKVAGHQAMYSQIQEDAENFLASQGKEWVNGLPPVGAECEVLWIGEWHQTKIIGYDDGLPVFKSDWEDRYAYACGADARFRPLQSDRDKAIEELEREFSGINFADSTARGLAIHFYEQGLRKPIGRDEAKSIMAKVLEQEHGYTYDSLADALGFDQ